jgi:glucosamine-6-phosphate deaminase
LILPDEKAVGLRAANMVESLLRKKPTTVLGLAAGATPEAMYAHLVRRHIENGLDFAQSRLFGLDEYLGLGADHPASCANTLRRCLIDQVNVAPHHVRLFDGRHTGDLPAYCADYEERIAQAGGIDLQILGLGVNGHIGFNEPGCSLGGRCHPLALRSSTRKTNGPIFEKLGQQVPAAAISMGVATILSARRILLLATGPKKADAVAKAVEGPVTAMLPASALQLHPDAVMLLDEAAAAKLSLRADYEAEAQTLASLPGCADLFG